METAALALTFLAALGAGVMAGFFYAFSGLVMPALARRPTAEAVAAMQTINVVVLNPGFFALFFGTAAVGVAAAAVSLFAFSGFDAVACVGAATVYVVGAVGVTMASNVPLNQRLAALPADAPEAEALWRGPYLGDWVRWNHVRAIACALAAAGFAAALI
jgi:uncharacterized membrane protein